jgi:hypothetical protein
MLRAARLLPQLGLATLRFSPRRFPLALGACYRAPWRLPGPDLHRLVNTSLHEIAYPRGITSFKTSRSLGTLAYSLGDTLVRIIGFD